eukprot:scaffold243379_cov39-Prasinocladus_malaysianus.AAC.1
MSVAMPLCALWTPGLGRSGRRDAIYPTMFVRVAWSNPNGAASSGPNQPVTPVSLHLWTLLGVATFVSIRGGPSSVRTSGSNLPHRNETLHIQADGIASAGDCDRVYSAPRLPSLPIELGARTA